ncbi:tape measure protein [Schinkia azotoformans]|nr:tape measure protein [Schinkia azotoformans]MEC1716601.1 tape measure protein [Schinkia azotoformans]MEC1739439.1 tape measure protein [Schinkia azotoformans]MEC1745491.1 tape measure protein [Schinkia azotoformans]MEC1756554.1 tape measure protein [Schinkia azotoformans]MEC1765821.1 tape measure protein [Schinkia azotoformans]
MATIRTAIQINDMMSQQFRAMNLAMMTVIDSFQTLQDTTGNAIDISALNAAQHELQQVEASFNQIEQEIRQAEQAQNGLNNEIREGSSAADGFLGKLSAIAATYLGFQSGQAVLTLSDETVGTIARLDMINDELQSTAVLQEKIFQAADRSRGSYSAMADQVAKLSLNAADAFKTNDEAILFSELLNKHFTISRTNVEGIQSATLQLTQALGSGVLRGEELNAVFEATPTVIQDIADYLGVGIGQIREMASEGQITAEIVKQSMFAAADEINQKFESMPWTFGQLWIDFKNDALKAFLPVLQQLNEIANNEKFQNMINFAAGSIANLSNVAMAALNIITNIGSFMYDNWSIIGPTVGTATVAISAYVIALGIAKTATIASAFWIGAKTLALGLMTTSSWAGVQATMSLTAAQWGLNAAVMANPIFIIVFAIIALVGVIYGAVAAYNYFAGTSISATGAIVGAFAFLGAFIWNTVVGVINAIIQVLWTNFAEPWIGIIEWVLNVFNGGFNSFGDAVANLLGQIISWFLSLGKVVTTIIDSIFGTNWSAGLSSLQNSVLSWGKNEAAITIDRTPLMINSRFEYSGAWETGYNWGSGTAESSMADFRRLDEESMKNSFDYSSILDNVALASKDTAGNTKKMADSIDMSTEDLKYLRDLAEQEVVNRFTTAEIKVEMTNHNNINSDRNLDGIVEYLTEKVEEAMYVSAEGVHA